ncbi:hypothetical protein [Methanoculleus sp.]|uniref:hypothetical protein n=1 Tax=Methanoculleus sp. TaxID=90427 RepID=UPI0025DCD35C|nr:hypothetical protein [Methanoculleus sp.]
MEKPSLAKHLLRQDGIVIPEKIFKQKFMEQFERALYSKQPIIVSYFFKKASNNMAECLNYENIEVFFNRLVSDKYYLEGKYCDLITEDDKKILNLVAKTSQSPVKDFLEISGPLVYLTEVIGELEEKWGEIPQTIQISVFIWLFSTTFELILHMTDRRLFAVILDDDSINNNDRRIVKFREDVKRDEYHDHALPGMINGVLQAILGMPPNNNSIFGNNSDPKSIRNKISHSNLFYDSEKNKIVRLDGKEYEVEDLLKYYFHMYQFLIKWIEISLDSPVQDIDLEQKFGGEMESFFNTYSQKFAKYQRYGYQKYFSMYIINLYREAKGSS